MKSSKPNILRQLFNHRAPWYIKVARTGVLSLAGIAAFPHLMENLPGEPLPEIHSAPLRAFYQQAANPDAIRIHSSPAADTYLNIVGAEAAAFGEVVLLRQHYRPLPGKKDPYLQYILAHELGHVRQHENGMSLAYLQTAWEKVQSLITGHNLYEYALEKGKPFAAYGIEQQASILADYFNISHGREPICLTNRISTAEREALYREVLQDFLKDRAPEPVPSV